MRTFRVRVGLLVLLVVATFILPLHCLRMIALRSHHHAHSKRVSPPVKRLLSSLPTVRHSRTERRIPGGWLRVRLRTDDLWAAPNGSIHALPLSHRQALGDSAGSVFPLRC